MTDVTWAELPQMGAAGPHNRYGGVSWEYSGDGVFVAGSSVPERTPGEPATARRISGLMGAHIKAACVWFDIPAEILVMTIATEAAQFWQQNYTGPATFRWEPHVKVKDVTPEDTGDYSAGPMQVLASTARWIIRTQMLPYEPFTAAPHFWEAPNIPPDEHPLYDPGRALTIGGGTLAKRWDRTGDDPVLVAAAYNAGGHYESHANRWHLRSTGNHLDRAARWFGDACAVLQELRDSGA